MKQDKMEKSTGMNIFTVVVCAVLVAMMIGAYIYLFTADDFVLPTTESASEDSGEDEEDSSEGDSEENSAVWDATIEDLIAYLDELGFIDADDGSNMSAVGTENYIYNGIDIIWWDVDNLVEGTDEYEYWIQLSEDGYILLYGQYVYSPIRNGPFAIQANAPFPGDTDALYAAFAEFPVTSGDGDEGDETSDSGVWDAAMDDLIAYLDKLGYLDADDYDLLSEVGTENYLYNGIDIMWWDVDNLVEGTEAYEYWTQLNENGYILLYGQYVYTPVQNGPFAIYANTTFPGDTDALYADFAAFTGAAE